MSLFDDLMFLSLHSKICRAGMVESPYIYITFYWLQELCVIILIENLCFESGAVLCIGS
jgi:hypothetical protein